MLKLTTQTSIEEMVILYQLRDEEQDKQRWTNWFEGAKEGGIPTLERFAVLKEKRLPGLLAHAKIPISTGKPKGFNNVIKTAKRAAVAILTNIFFLRLICFLSLPRTWRFNRFL